MSRCLLVLGPGPFAVNTSWGFHTRAFAKDGTLLPMLSRDPEVDCELSCHFLALRWGYFKEQRLLRWGYQHTVEAACLISPHEGQQKGLWAGSVVEVLGTKPDAWILRQGTHVEEENQFPQIVSDLHSMMWQTPLSSLLVSFCLFDTNSCYVGGENLNRGTASIRLACRQVRGAFS